ncbi:MAG: hypothetical protein MK171_10105 [Pirellulales bacterium]|nr:hypothetical protein [Pirellulales bacterium]
MLSRTLSIPVLLAAAVGAPYVATNTPNVGQLWDTPPNGTTQSGVTPAIKSSSVPPAPPQGPSVPAYSKTTPLEGIRNMSLPEIFRFNLDREWVYRRWARKSTGLADLGLYGIRVPLVSGTQLDDLAGSLTYYFDAVGRLQRISFRGNTGDTTQLVLLLTQTYGLQRQSAPIAGEQLFQLRRGQHVTSELRTRPAPVLRATTPHESFAVEVELQRPGATTPLARKTPTLPTAEPEPSPPATEVAQEDKVIEPEQGDKKKVGKEKWDALFPRSRVPKGQVNSLEKRDRFW